LGYDVVLLPKTGVVARADFVLETLARAADQASSRPRPA